MDRLDVAILREMTQAQMVLPGRPGVAPSSREIARKLKLPPGTVRYRIRRMYSSGVVRGSSVYPNLNLIGLKGGSFNADVSPLLDKTEAVRKLRLVEGVHFVHDFVGSLVWAVFAYEDDRSLATKLSAMRDCVGSDGFMTHIPYPPCNTTLTRPEAELTLRLVKREFDSYASLAKEEGISARTLQRRLSKIVKEGAVLSVPKVDYSAMSECVPADLIVRFKNQDAAMASQKTILPLVGEYVILAALWDVVGMCSMILPNIASVKGIAEKVKSMEGVAAARVEIVREHIDQVSGLESHVLRWMSGKQFRVGPLLAQKGLTR